MLVIRKGTLDVTSYRFWNACLGDAHTHTHAHWEEGDRVEPGSLLWWLKEPTSLPFGYLDKKQRIMEREHTGGGKAGVHLSQD